MFQELNEQRNFHDSRKISLREGRLFKFNWDIVEARILANGTIKTRTLSKEKKKEHFSGESESSVAQSSGANEDERSRGKNKISINY